ncbi:hypothetical protein U3A55_11915 [Salarchaeum sp. III]|uniref:hypothetical protein n=1 Tax=Salarchaeum sp. III TaxID=3107927 RepID=UPI002ED978E2
MTGAGSATTLAFGKEQEFLGSLVDEDSDGTPGYWAFGRNATLTELDLDRQLARLRDATSAEAVESIAGKIDGGVAVEAAVAAETHSHVHDIIFPGGTGFSPGRPPFSRVFTGVNHLDGSVDRELRGCIPLEYSVSFDEDTETVTYSLILGYATEPDTPTSIDQADVTTPSTGSTAAFHGFTLTLDGADVTKLSTCELTISNIARYHYGASAEPVDATIAAPEAELSATATFTSGSKDRLDLTYGGASATSIQDRMDSVSGSIDAQGPSGSIAAYTLPRVKLNDQSWENVISEEDTTDSITAHVNGGIEVQ